VSFVLILLLLTVPSSFSLLANAQTATSTPSVPTLAVPEFTTKFVNFSSFTPPIDSFNPYTGKNVVNLGYYVENDSIELIIKNQPFNSYISNGQNISLYYNVRFKMHNAENWINIFNGAPYPPQSNANFTANDFFGSNYTYQIGTQQMSLFPNDSVDFQVQAQAGYFKLEPYMVAGNTSPMGFIDAFTAVISSGWSNTQTVTIPSSFGSSNLIVPELSWLIILPMFVFMLFVAVIFNRRKTAKAESKETIV
jgi:hypothetical protein